jgi:hypothetical protein
MSPVSPNSFMITYSDMSKKEADREEAHAYGDSVAMSLRQYPTDRASAMYKSDPGRMGLAEGV